MADTERRAFLIFTIVVCILFIFLFGYNLYSWNRLRTNNVETSPVNRSEANVLFWLNLVWIVVALALLIWAIYEATQSFKANKVPEYKILNVPKQQMPAMVPSVQPVAPPVVSQVIPLYKTTSMQKDEPVVCRL
jgi:magnesium-transporting ATPase (P-type)